jgi:hypothetical protein
VVEREQPVLPGGVEEGSELGGAQGSGLLYLPVNAGAVMGVNVMASSGRR